MALKDLIPQPVVINAGAGTLTLHPLTLKDVIYLSGTYLPELSSLMEGETTNMASLLVKSPIFAATLIAYSCREPNNVEDASNLPVSVQLIALDKLWGASMVDEEALGKLILRLSRGLKRINTMMREEAEKSRDGTLTSLPQ